MRELSGDHKEISCILQSPLYLYIFSDFHDIYEFAEIKTV